MNEVTTALSDLFKRSMKHYVEELQNRNDYEARMAEEVCIVCRGKANSPEYRIHGEKEWKRACKELEIKCKACTEQKELARVLERNKIKSNEHLNRRFEKEYWFIPEDLKNAGFKNFTVGNEGTLHEAKRTTMDYVKTFHSLAQEKRSNLLIMGNPGTGKTHLTTAVARTLKEKGILVGHLTTGTLLSKIKSTYQKGSKQTEEGIFNDLRKFELLVLDDLGSEARSKDEFDWSKNKLFEIVNLRVGKPTIYTSNFNEQHLPSAVGERVYSRLHHRTNFIKLVTEDFRKKYQGK
ncbi:ATP-binding protein [Bacillus sp. FJAT-44742]|uniref:ATP-binding protein n=1 Tax=Bacillus sp. FJAT-44742 TaxID=2014005 RepID=UPI000C2478A9|nr:ATP-binding protein [Bacillus sp. FJAT-44742]